MANCEHTFIEIKPDGVQWGLVGEIIMCFEQKGFCLVGLKFMQASEDLLKEHYIDLEDRPFFAGLVKYMHSGPVVAMVWEGLNVVKTGRVMLGETNPADSMPGTIRGDFCIQVGRNIIHGSDSVESAKKEISLWFHPEELVDYKSCAQNWIYEGPDSRPQCLSHSFPSFPRVQDQAVGNLVIYKSFFIIWKETLGAVTEAIKVEKVAEVPETTHVKMIAKETEATKVEKVAEVPDATLVKMIAKGTEATKMETVAEVPEATRENDS
ncbi:hypothetical protein P7K49_023122 [Saguinus oedipus]|uniref:Nucleoside diphosphate kinase n=1 Tax=Saguinus oedipus TaxID=9490 RepID=A0ABQ9ULE6_SAGOE|nr:hypothetical protein P7K49_023122 [Saguinus oedipus]